MKNAIISRYYVIAEIILASPLSLSGGIGENTDSDVMRDGEGKLVIPGSSVAGAFRRYLGQKRNEEGVFGYSKKNRETDKEEGCMSSLFFSDIYFEEKGTKNDAVVSERDGVNLTEEKVVDNKFDYEVIETGAKAIMRIEKVYRQKDEKKGMENSLTDIQTLLNALDKGEIRIGARKNRGCGWIKVEKVYRHAFGVSGQNAGNTVSKKEQAARWINFCLSGDERDEEALWRDWRKELEQKKFVHIEIPLRLTGGISIRKYSTQPEEADFEHITVHGDAEERIPVIPGSSWNGAIRSCARNILRELEVPDVDKKLTQWFGTANDSGREENKARQSMVVIRESILQDTVPLKSTRNKINRFDASTVDGALYTEKAYFGGKTTLNILVQKTENEREYYPLIALLSLVIREIEDGYLAIGGQTAVGRGVFETDTKGIMKAIWDEKITEVMCMEELAALKGGC